MLPRALPGGDRAQGHRRAGGDVPGESSASIWVNQPGFGLDQADLWRDFWTCLRGGGAELQALQVCE
eukprot:3933152-Rhodomonas_salina.2